MTTQLLDLSLGGLGLAADDALVTHIQDGDEQAREIRPQEFRVEFTLPRGSGDSAVGLYCRLVYKRRLSQRAYQLGARILEYEGESAGLLEQFIGTRQG